MSTALGVSALAEMTSEFHGKESDLSFDIKFDDESVVLGINETNSNDVQQRKLSMKPSYIQNVHLNANGMGIGFVAISCNFVRQIENLQPSFFLSVHPKLSESEQVITLNICTNFIPKEFKTSNGMAIVEADLPSGFRFQNSDEMHKSLLKSEVGVRVRVLHIW